MKRLFSTMRLGIFILTMATLVSTVASGEKPLPAKPDQPAAQHIGRDLVDLYEQAVATMEKTCDDYRRIKAMHLAQQRDIAFSAAYEHVQSVMPRLEPVDKELLRRKIVDPADLKEHETEVNKVKKQIEDMIELTTKLLLEIEKMEAEAHAEHMARFNLRLEEIVRQPLFDPAQAKQETPKASAPTAAENASNQTEPDKQEGENTEAMHNAILQAAMHDNKQRAKDLTPFMRRPAPDIRDLTHDDREKYKKHEIRFFQDQSAPSGKDGFAITPRNIILARDLKEEGTEAEWMFIDTWYTIGPFPNPSRINILRKFPPETVVDLDATYIGKDNRQIRWQFRQIRDPKIIPADAEEYGIWYAYTEIYMDRPCDLWVALGSDDKGTVWLNDQPIWISGDQLKGWRIDEAFRKVHFQAGRNRILYRVENGWYAVNFSFGIRLPKGDGR